MSSSYWAISIFVYTILKEAGGDLISFPLELQKLQQQQTRLTEAIQNYVDEETDRLQNIVRSE